MHPRIAHGLAVAILAGAAAPTTGAGPSAAGGTAASRTRSPAATDEAATFDPAVVAGPRDAVSPAASRPDEPARAGPALVDLAFDRATRAEALYRLAQAADLDLVCAGDVAGTVSGQFVGRPAPEVLSTLITQGALSRVQVGRITVVAAHALAPRAVPVAVVSGPGITLRVCRAHLLPLLDVLETDTDLAHLARPDLSVLVTAHITRRPPAEALAALAMAAGLTLDISPGGHATLHD